MPPIYDAPETMRLYDAKSAASFTSDCFGAPLEASAENAETIAARGAQGASEHALASAYILAFGRARCAERNVAKRHLEQSPASC